MKKEGRNIAAICVESGRRSEFAQLLTCSQDSGSHPPSVEKTTPLCASSPLPCTHRIKVLTMGQLISTFLGRNLYSFGISETICFLKNTCHWIPFSLTCDWNFCFNSFFYKGCLLFMKDDKTKTTSSFITFSAFMFCHSELFFSFPLSVSFPQLSAASSPSSHSPHRASGKDPFAELSLEDFL